MIKKSYIDKRTKSGQDKKVGIYSDFKKVERQIEVTDGYPKTIQYFATPFKGGEGGKHPTQKPLSLMEYLIRTYTNENETVLDFTMGSGSTMVACHNTNRNGIGIEQDENYFKIAQDRVKENYKLMQLYSPTMSIQSKQKVDWNLANFKHEFSYIDILKMMRQDGFGELNWSDMKIYFDKMVKLNK